MAAAGPRRIREVINARVWAGIHFRTADLQGAILGKKVAHYLQRRCAIEPKRLSPPPLSRRSERASDRAAGARLGRSVAVCAEA
jgi:hypothetical protein